jgi:hypothetical protein
VDGVPAELPVADTLLPRVQVASLDQIAGINPTLDLDFANQVYRHYSPATGLREKDLSDIVTFTRASSATYFDAKGVMQTAGSNEPRIDFDPVTGECKGLLIEESRTNLLNYSEQFDDAAWVKYADGDGAQPVVVANDTEAPDGTVSADKVTLNCIGATVSDSSAIQQLVTVTPIAYAGTAWLKAATTNDIGKTIQFRHAGASGVTTITLEATWVRVERLETGYGSGQTAFLFRRIGSVTPGNYPVSFHVWGAQLEAAASPTSYIKTEAATAARAADVAAVSGTAFTDYHHTLGTLFAQYKTGGWKHVVSPAISALNLVQDILTAAQVNDAVQRVIFFPRVLSDATISQIKAI